MIRPLDASSLDEVELVASRMRDTLVEVLGEERGGSMYTRDWLIARVRFHVDAGVVLVFAEAEGITGHAMARVEDGVGHFSTIYVVPSARRRGVAAELMRAIESWLASRGVPEMRYYTDDANTKLIALFEKSGWTLTERHSDSKMVKLSKSVRA